MTPSARLSAAIEVFSDLTERRRPANDALKDWGLARRFAGSGDRAAVSALVYDSLRKKSSAAWIMGAETPRAILLGTLHLTRGMSVDAIAALCGEGQFAAGALTENERVALEKASLAEAPAFIAGDYPEWLDADFAEAFGDRQVDELQAMAKKAPVDIRVNLLKSDVESVATELAYMGAVATQFSPVGLRIPPKEDGRAPSVQSEPAFQKGMIEIQDEGSQLAVQIAAPDPGMQVVDLCAGGGGKTLALAAIMGNRGQIFATDSDKRRLAPIFDRLTRAGARNVQVRSPKGKDDEPLEDLLGRVDLVIVDAPCTGTGTWRRNPDAKWRVRPNSLDDRIADQAKVLDRAARLVKTGGKIAYITCSLIPRENDGSVEAFLGRNPGFEVISPELAAREASLEVLSGFVSSRGNGLLLTPLRTDTDGFFICMIRKTA